RLPPGVTTLALALRPQGVDLLSADLETLRAILERVRSGELEADEQLLGRLNTFIFGQEYLDWEEILPDQEVVLAEQAPVRGRGELILEDAEGRKARLLLSGETVPAQRISRIEAPLWAQAPQLRMFRTPDYARSRVELPLTAGLVNAIPAEEGGYLAAVTVIGHSGPQTVVMRRNGEGRLLWSARPAAGTQLLPSVLLPLQGGDYLMAGSGPVVRFNDAGEMIEASSLTEATVVAGAVQGEEALLAGEMADASGVQLLALNAEGTLAWEQQLAAWSRAQHLAALPGQGWVVAGQDGESRPALALLGRQGEVIWQAQPGVASLPSAVEALAVSPQGQVVLGGQVDGGGLWLRRFDPQSHEVGVITPSGASSIPALDGVHAMTFDAEGQLLIGGEARTENGWMARMDSDGGVLWSREYGVESAREVVLDVLPLGETLVAIGRLQAGSRREPPSVWQMPLDAEGRPLAAPALPDEVLTFQEQLRDALVDAAPVMGTLGAPEFSLDEQGVVHLALPWLTVESDWDFQRYSPDVEWVIGDLHMQLGAVENGLRPIGLEVPDVVDVRDPQGGLAGRLTFGPLEFSGQWNDALDTLHALKAEVDDVRLDLHPQEGMMGAVASQAALAQMEGKDVPRQLTFGRIGIEVDTRQREDGLYDLPGRFHVENVELASFIEAPLLRLDRLDLQTEQRDVTLETLLALGKEGEKHEVFRQGNPLEVLGTLVDAVGNPSARFAIEGLSVRGDNEYEYLRLASLHSDIGIGRHAEDDTQRDLWARLALEGLAFSEGSERRREGFAIDSLSFNGEIDQISPMAIIQVGMASLMAGQPSEPELLALSQQMFSRWLLALEVDGFEGVDKPSQGNPHLFGTDRLSFRTEFTELDTAAPNWSLDVLHEAIRLPPAWNMPPQADAYLPERSDISLLFKRLPTGFAEDQETVARLKRGELDPGQLMLEQMLANRTLLDIPRWQIDLPNGAISLAGRGWTEEGEGGAPGLVRGQFDLRIVQLDRLTAHWLEAAPDDQARQDLESMFTMLRLLGEERESPDGDSEHVFRIELDSLGNAQVNGEDLAPLLQQLDG
ncbi:MAG: hypothetical protein RI841_13490, partial [Halomonas sp.]|uniref:hypothetical protein n=1 Tax=Halomonas sp. TaxID=1486246 RepID=UPI0028702CE4